MSKLWAGRTSGEVSSIADDFNSSIRFDCKLYKQDITGSVKLKLYKGNIIPAGTTSPYSLYSENLVTFGESDYDQNQAAGFINLWGLPTKVQALREQGKL